jgi:hypothetical protein
VASWDSVEGEEHVHIAGLEGRGAVEIRFHDGRRKRRVGEGGRYIFGCV